VVLLNVSNAVGIRLPAMKTRIIAPLLQIGLMSIWPVVVVGQLWRPDYSPEQIAYEELISTRCFSFGGAGYGVWASIAEEAFHSIMSTTNALETFSRVLTNGTPEAQLYALCGIRKLAPENFEQSARSLLASNPNVDEMGGCFFWREAASNVIQRIRGGSYYLDTVGKEPLKIELKL
jgi:hypothetical protein